MKRIKSAKNLAGLKGRSKIPRPLFNAMTEIEKKYGNKIESLELEYVNESLRATYLSNENNKWRVLAIKQMEITPELADELFESSVSKADFLIKLIDDQSKISGMLNSIFEVENTIITPELDSKIKQAFSSIKNAIKPDGIEDLEVKGNTYSQDFRKWDYFTDRDGEEDDDQPDFTSRDKVLDLVKSKLSGIKYKRLLVFDSEKKWFTVQVII